MSTIPIDKARTLANEVLARVDSAENVYINNLHSTAHHPPLDGPFELENGIGISAIREADQVIARARYSVTSRSEASGEVAWNVSVDVISVHRLAGDAPEFSHDALQCFALGTGITTCHPYAREVVQSITGKLGYPPATLDLLISPLSGNADIEIADE